MMKVLRSIGLVAVILFAFTVGTAFAAVETNEQLPLDMWVWVSCANGGIGESVHLTGELHVLDAVTFDQNGGVHIVSQAQPMGIAGYGQITGDKYQGTGVTRSAVSFWTADYPYHLTYVNNFRMIGAGPGNNFTVHEVVHVTVNANGDVTSQIDTYSADCK